MAGANWSRYIKLDKNGEVVGDGQPVSWSTLKHAAEDILYAIIGEPVEEETEDWGSPYDGAAEAEAEAGINSLA